jgi:hypothetical protein
LCYSFVCDKLKARADNDIEEADESEDYSWDYDDNAEVQEKQNRKLLISLTRDWLGRENPDASPTYGFFPVWAFFLLLVAGNYFKIFHLKTHQLMLCSKMQSFLLAVDVDKWTPACARMPRHASTQ